MQEDYYLKMINQNCQSGKSEIENSKFEININAIQTYIPLL